MRSELFGGHDPQLADGGVAGAGEVAERLGGRQGDISRIENRSDLLLSTLLSYLTATGAEDARIIVTVHGREYDLDLASLASSKATATA
jgi:hypothetical protein